MNVYVYCIVLCPAKGKYGSQSMRLSKDSIKDFDCCSLTLQPCRNPIIT